MKKPFFCGQFNAQNPSTLTQPIKNSGIGSMPFFTKIILTFRLLGPRASFRISTRNQKSVFTVCWLYYTSSSSQQLAAGGETSFSLFCVFHESYYSLKVVCSCSGVQIGGKSRLTFSYQVHCTNYFILHSGPENLKKSRQKKITREIK